MNWRDVLEANSDQESDYLILSDEGCPLSQPSIVQFFQILRNRFPEDLPPNLTAKSLRHTFSSNMEKLLRDIGLDEQRRMEALADLRGDTSLSSQETYIAQEIQEQANIAMCNYHRKLLG
jgi:integrase